MKTSHVTDVVFALTGDVRKNSRALRQIRALTGRGLDVDVLSVHTAGPSSLDIPRARLHQIPTPRGSGIRFFWQIHKNFTNVAGRIRARSYHASDLYGLPALSAAASKHGATLAYDARELYPYVAATIGRPWIRLFWMQVERRYITRADAVFTVSAGIADKLVELYGIAQPTVIYNAPERSDSAARESLGEHGNHHATQTVILHLGQMRPYRGCERLVDAMQDIEAASLVFLGDGPLRHSLEKQAADARIESRVHFLDPVPPDEVLTYTQSADIGVTLLDDVCLNHRLALPNKLFEYLTANVPVIASDLPEIRKVVREYDVGQLVHSGSREDLVAALSQAVLDKSLREHWRKNIPSVLETFSWEAASHDFLRVYNELLPSS